MQISLCDILNYPPQHRGALCRQWAEESQYQNHQREKAEARRQKQQEEREAETPSTLGRPRTPEGYIEYHFDGKLFSGMPIGIRLLITTEDRAETNLFAAPPVIAIGPDHPFWEQHRKTQVPEPEGAEPVTIPMPRRAPPPPIPASNPPRQVEASTLSSLKVQSWTLSVQRSSEAPPPLPMIRGFPLSRAGPPNAPTSVTTGIQESDFPNLPSSNSHLRAFGAPLGHDCPTKSSRLPIFDSTRNQNEDWDRERPARFFPSFLNLPPSAAPSALMNASETLALPVERWALSA